MKTSNVADRCKNYYESEDFKNNYSFALFESFSNNEGDILNRIKDIIDHDYYFEKKYGFNKYLSNESIQKIYNYIAENLDQFITDFNGYYVGYSSLDSIEFSEQEEQLIGLYNHKTGKEYNIDYLRKVFKNSDYYVKNNYAYYNLDGGLHVDLLHADIPLNLFEE